MPDGEVLPGTFSVSEAGQAPAAAAAAGTEAGNFYATARGPRTVLTCRGNLVAGHGTADCQTQNGARYRMQI